MSYTAGLLRDRIDILSRTQYQADDFGLNASGMDFSKVATVWADVSWAKGKQALNAGSIDVYGVIMVRMRYTTLIDERCRITHNGKTYQILADTFHADFHDNEIQFQAQAVINE